MRNFVTQKVIPEFQRVSQKLIQNQQLQALHIKSEAYNHFISMVHQNHATLVSDYSKHLLMHYDLMNQLTGNKQQKTDESLSISVSQIHNNMFMLKIQNQRLKCRQKLLQQKLECQKILFRKRKQDCVSQQRERKMKIQQIKLLKEEVSNLQSILEKKKKVALSRKNKQQMQHFLPKVKNIVLKYNGQTLLQKLNQILYEIEKSC